MSTIGAVLLAAGSSTRAGSINKLLHPIEGEAMVRRVAQAVVDAQLAPCIVVLGHEAARVREALAGLPLRFVVNEAHAQGMGRSIAAGFTALREHPVDAAAIVLGDMPYLRSAELRRLCAAYHDDPRAPIVAPEAVEQDTTRLGNPVIWPRRHFQALEALQGDRGAKRLLLAAPDELLRVRVDHPGVLRDIDTPRS